MSPRSFWLRICLLQDCSDIVEEKARDGQRENDVKATQCDDRALHFKLYRRSYLKLDDGGGRGFEETEP